MKSLIFISLFAILNFLNNELIENQEIITYELKIEMERKNYTIKSNQTYKFINSNEKFIYFIELPKGLIASIEFNITFKDLVYLSNINQSVNIISEDSTQNNNEIHITSILKNIEILYLKMYYSTFSYRSNKNIILLVYTKENENQIISLNSFENSQLFYYYKYNFTNISPKDLCPINKTLFNKIEDNIIYLDNNSVYIFIAELFKFDYYNIFFIDIYAF